MNFKKYLNAKSYLYVYKKKFKLNYKTSYSQTGEDLIVDYIFRKIGISKPSYIDIGAHHPYEISNTAIFYARGCTGINVEPDPHLFKQFLIDRKKDVNLNIGIAKENSIMDYFVMESSALNSFSKATINELKEKHSINVREILKINTYTINSVLHEYNNGIFPDFLSLDVEGLDMEILASIDYDVSFPKVICVETMSFSTTGRGKKNEILINFLKEKQYMIFADTYINTIFVYKKEWEKLYDNR